MILFIFQIVIALLLIVHFFVHIFFLLRKSSFLLRFNISLFFLCLFLFYLIFYGIAGKHWPWKNSGEILVLISFLIVVIQVFIECQTREKTIAIIPAALSFFCGLLGMSSLHAFSHTVLLSPEKANNVSEMVFLSSQTYPIEFFFFFLSCIFLIYALGMSFFYRIIFHTIKWQKNFFLVHRVPSLKVLERYMMFFTILSLFFLFGVLFFRYFYHWFSMEIAEQNSFLTKNLLPSLVAWMVAAITMGLRLMKRIDASSVYYGLILSVIFIVINFFLIV